MTNIQEMYQLILEMDKLKSVFRNTLTSENRRESTAEHSWSAAMIVMILMRQLKEEFPGIDKLKIIKLILIHDVVEIYAGDVIAFDLQARKEKEKVEIEALEKLAAICPSFGTELRDLWYEFEKCETSEAKIAKAADGICPIFQRLQAKQSYLPINITIEQMDKIKYPRFAFSKAFLSLYEQLKSDLLAESLIRE
jgi:putative hydrolase of HD superfamily